MAALIEIFDILEFFLFNINKTLHNKLTHKHLSYSGQSYPTDSSHKHHNWHVCTLVYILKGAPAAVLHADPELGVPEDTVHIHEPTQQRRTEAHFRQTHSKHLW